jgi:hypothetical protein
MSTQISFSLRVSSGVKTVHLIGSWDNYSNQLPLSKDKNSSSGKSWKGTFRFSSSTLEAGERYWYYYIVDGYHCAANPSVPSIVEPTTGRELNILDVPEEKSSSSSGSSSSKSKSSSSSSKHSSSKHSSSSSSKHSSSSSSKHSSSSSSSKSKSSSSSSSKDKDKDKDRKSRHLSVDIPKGRPLSVSDIVSPKPVTPHATSHILRYDEDDIDALAAQFGGTVMIDEEGAVSGIHMGSPTSSATGSSYRSDVSSPSGSSGSGYSTPNSDYGRCTCERYGITRKGDRVKIDCGGQVCGYDDSSDCSSGSEADYQTSPVHRRGVVIR